MSYYRNATKSRSYHGSGNRRRNNFKSNKPRGVKGRGQYIDPIKFVKPANPQIEEKYVPTHSFEDFDINPKIKKNLAEKGFKEPSPIQDQSIPAILDSKDLIGIANTGTGKTAAFGIPLIHQLLADKNQRAIIIAPTRELAQQIRVELNNLTRGAFIKSALLIGGSNMGYQIKDLKKGPQLIIGTPGRIKDHIERGNLNLTTFTKVVLDEVDRMLDMGFIDDMKQILNAISSDRQSLFFSATMDRRVEDLIQTFSNNPITVSVKTGDTSDNVHQNVINYRHHTEKPDKLQEALLQDLVEKAIVFEETQRDVERLARELVNRGFATDSIHGGKNQGQRQRALRRFKENQVDILVATDVAARGIDVKDVTHVFNYSIPQTYEDYTHRIGRAGRAGKVGYALTFVKQ
ncbi:DEAD/DEAH box helicase [Candidatus Saccharibacteria bacterium]|nr:DEAD/DEAH box helicase [Candidatus Saccharibacteria bacterium]